MGKDHRVGVIMIPLEPMGIQLECTLLFKGLVFGIEGGLLSVPVPVPAPKNDATSLVLVIIKLPRQNLSNE